MRTARIHEFLSKTWLAKNPFETKSLKNFLQNSGIYSHKIQSAHQRLKCSDEISVTLCPSTNKEEGGRAGGGVGDEIYICDKFCCTYWRLRDSCIVVSKLFNDLLVGSLLLNTLIDFFQQYKAMQI